MKRFGIIVGIFLVVCLVFTCTRSEAGGVPQLINYQGYLTLTDKDENGNPIPPPTGKYKMAFKIYNGSGIALWGPKTINDVTVVNGHFNVLLGQDDAQQPITSAFGSDTAYLEIIINDKTILPRQQFLSVPYVTVAGGVPGPVYAKPIYVKDIKGKTLVSIEGNLDGAGTIETLSTNGNGGVLLSSSRGNSNYGNISVKELDGGINGGMYVDASAQGSVIINNRAGDPRVFMGAGIVETRGPNGHLNIAMDRQGIGVKDALGNSTVQIDQDIQIKGPIRKGYLDPIVSISADSIAVSSNGQEHAIMSPGNIVADVKSFRMSNPYMEGTEIQYACIEGPEAGAYIRGTGRLINGKTVVKFPRDFMTVVNSKNVTVRLTPLSAESKGLAVVDKGVDGFTVKELFTGNGTYDFDYLVMAVRKGYENYQVIRPISDRSGTQNKKEKIQ